MVQNKMKTKRKYRSINQIRTTAKNINYISILVIIIMLILSITFLILGLNSKNNIKTIYSYSAQKNVDYKVLLKPNDFYVTETLPSGKYYAAKSVNKYIINFIYDFKASKKTNLNYNYNISAEIIGTVPSKDNQNQEVWNRTFPILENKESIYKDNFFVNEQVEIDYDYYNNLARSYEETYGIEIEATLKVYFNISCINENLKEDKIKDHIELNEEDKNLKENIKPNEENKTINENIKPNEEDKTIKETIKLDEENKINDRIELDIDLSNTVTKVNKNYDEATNKEVMLETQNTEKIVFYILSGICAIICITVIVVRLKQNIKTPEQKYEHNIKRILKYYKELIVTVTNEPNLADLKIMDITSIDDLIDVAEQNNSTIIHYEAIKNKRSNLYVIVNNYVYVYVVTDEILQ